VSSWCFFTSCWNLYQWVSLYVSRFFHVYVSVIGSQRVRLTSDLSRRPRIFSLTASSNHACWSYDGIFVFPWLGCVANVL